MNKQELNQKIGEKSHTVYKYNEVAVRNALSIRVGRKLKKIKDNGGELPENYREEDVIQSLKCAISDVQRREEALQNAKERKKEWVEIARTLGVIDA